jgi:hypothetical protein
MCAVSWQKPRGMVNAQPRNRAGFGHLFVERDIARRPDQICSTKPMRFLNGREESGACEGTVGSLDNTRLTDLIHEGVEFLRKR